MDRQLFINSLVDTHLIIVMLIFKRENIKNAYCELLVVSIYFPLNLNINVV